MSSTPHDIVLIQGLVKGDGLGEPLDGVGDALLEAAAPELVLFVVGSMGLGRGGGENHASLRHCRSPGEESERGERAPSRELGCGGGGEGEEERARSC